MLANVLAYNDSPHCHNDSPHNGNEANHCDNEANHCDNEVTMIRLTMSMRPTTNTFATNVGIGGLFDSPGAMCSVVRCVAVCCSVVRCGAV